MTLLDLYSIMFCKNQRLVGAGRMPHYLYTFDGLHRLSVQVLNILRLAFGLDCEFQESH